MSTAASISVVICAYTQQRWRDIVSAVASIKTQTVRALEVVLVVDHNPQLARRAEAEFSNAVTVLENRHARGLSGARNTALNVVRGDIIAFLDDDASARPDWLENLLACYTDPSVMAAGGAAFPIWPNSRVPHKLPSALLWIVGCSFDGQHPNGEPPMDVRNLMGCNMSFRSGVFATVGGFSEGVGRLGNIPLGCEETELCIRLRQQVRGARIVFEPRAAVDHRVTAERTSWSYLWRRAWAEGVSKARITLVVGDSDGLSSERSYVVVVLPATIVRETGRVWRGAISRDPQRLRAGAAGVTGVVLAVVAAGLGYAVQWLGHLNLRSDRHSQDLDVKSVPVRSLVSPRSP
jgi:GT2 family glycosyltransferase